MEIELRRHPSISQQHGFTQAGAVSAIADSAAGYAALTLAPDGAGVLTTEFKINLIAPATGDRLIALLTSTVMTITGKGDVSD